MDVQNKKGAPGPEDTSSEISLRGAVSSTGRNQLPGLVVFIVVLAVCFVVALPGAKVIVGFLVSLVFARPPQLLPSPAKADMETKYSPTAASVRTFLMTSSSLNRFVGHGNLALP